MFCLVPKKWDFKTQISTETWVSHFSGKASPPCRELHPPVSTSNAHHPSAGEEMPWSFGWGAELRLTCHQGKIGSQGTEKAFATNLLDKTELCGENRKSGTKQSDNLHLFCWLHFCKEVLGSLLKV